MSESFLSIFHPNVFDFVIHLHIGQTIVSFSQLRSKLVELYLVFHKLVHILMSNVILSSVSCNMTNLTRESHVISVHPLIRSLQQLNSPKCSLYVQCNFKLFVFYLALLHCCLMYFTYSLQSFERPKYFGPHGLPLIACDHVVQIILQLCSLLPN
jgi:hypothetical protein